MTQSKRLFAILFGSLVLAACGGGGAKDLSGGGTNPDPDPTESARVTVTTQACTDAANGTGCTAATSLSAAVNNRVEVLVVDASNKAVSGALVSATTTVGTLSPSTALTNSSGIAAFVLSAPAANSNSAGTITASYTDDSDKSVSDKQNFTFVPGQSSSDDYQLSVILKACDDIADISTCQEASRLSGAKASLAEVVLLDPTGKGVANTIVEATTTRGSIAPASSRLTDSAGRVTFLLSKTISDAGGAGTFTVNSHAGNKEQTASKPFEFGAANLSLTLTSNAPTSGLTAGAVALLTANVSLDGNPYPDPIEVTFSSGCYAAQNATLDAKVTARNGIAQATYRGMKDNNVCRDNDTVTATVDSTTVSVVINNLSAPARSLSAGTPSPEIIYLRGSGKPEVANVTFTLLDEQGTPVANKAIDFELSAFQAIENEYSRPKLNTAQAITDQQGNVTVTLNSGTLPGAIRIIARMHDEPTIQTASSPIAIGTGYPDDNSVSPSADKYNIEGWNFDGEEAKITLRLADRFNNPVPDGTKVFFITEGGSVSGNATASDGNASGSCSSVKGVCQATLVSQEPRPRDGRVTVTAYVEGEESFWDYNGNGIFDRSDISAAGIPNDLTAADVSHYLLPYKDVGEVFTDLNLDDATDTNSDIDGFRTNIDTFIDVDGDGKRSLGDGKYTGQLCSQQAKDAGFCVDASKNEKTFVNLFKNAEFIFTGVFSKAGAHTQFDKYVNICVMRKAKDAAAYAKLKARSCTVVDDNPKDLFISVWETAVNENGQAIALVDLRTQSVQESDGEKLLGAWTIAFATTDTNKDNVISFDEFSVAYPNTEWLFSLLDTDVNNQLSATEASKSIRVTPNGAYVNFTPTYVMPDNTENPMPAGSTFSVATTNGGELTPNGVSYNSPYPSTTRPVEYGLTIGQEAEPNKKSTGTLSITIKSPKGEAITTAFTVLDNG